MSLWRRAARRFAIYASANRPGAPIQAEDGYYLIAESGLTLETEDDA